MKVLWVFGWDDFSRCLRVLFETSQGHVLVKFGDETIDQSFYPTADGRVVRHAMFVRSQHEMGPEDLLKLWEALHAVNWNNLVFDEVYRQHRSECENGWCIPVSDIGLQSEKFREYRLAHAQATQNIWSLLFQVAMRSV